MFFRSRSLLVGSNRDVQHTNYRTVRLLLEEDGAPVSVTDISLLPGIEDIYGYADRTEVAYCLEGKAWVRDLETGEEHEIGPGDLWVAEPGSRFAFLASEPTRLICVFTPPLRGDETGLAD